ncbi:hypothetical protein F0562_002890 [Nyssa sinensis]|uniref:CSD domain-containing protein n=1 Tax=Nyssa sinensis TaxID=561372 RepID=A0A5J5BYM7_9ASTE|nr:hypothetical protein F0562_002890 [Nyssa sinensis]
MAEGKKSTGTVKWFSGQKGFGFITPDDGGEDLFVHQTEIMSDGFRTLREGQRVEFVVGSGEDGRTKAIEVAGVAGGATMRGGGTGGRRGYDWRGRGGGGFGRVLVAEIGDMVVVAATGIGDMAVAMGCVTIVGKKDILQGIALMTKNDGAEKRNLKWFRHLFWCKFDLRNSVNILD